MPTHAEILYGSTSSAPAAAASAASAASSSQHARALYGNAPATQPAAAASAASSSQHARALYGKKEVAYVPPITLAPKVEALRQARALTAAGSLYGETTFEAELPEDALPDIDHLEWRECAKDLGANSDQVRAFVALESQDPPTEEQHAAWVKESKTMLKERGYSDADLALARRLVERDPRVRDRLAAGTGSHPKVVEAFIQLAHAARRRGEL